MLRRNFFIKNFRIVAIVCVSATVNVEGWIAEVDPMARNRTDTFTGFSGSTGTCGFPNIVDVESGTFS